MAQHDFVINNQGFPAFRSDLNDFLNAVRTSHSGTSLPSGAVAGTIWLDTTNATTPILKYYDGTDNITLATINHSTNTVDFNDSAITTPLTVTGNATAGAELRLPEDTDNGSNYVALKAPDTLASNLTFTLPSSDGTNGQVLTTNASGVLSFTTPSAGIAFQSSVKTSGFTAVAGEGYFCNTTSAGFTVTLPASPTAGQQVAVVDYAGTFDTNALTISPNGNKIEGGTDNLQLTGEREGATFTFIDSTQGYLATSGINEGTDALSPVPYSIDFLVVAGGAGGQGGGGGAGGYRTSTQTVSVGTVITVTVGDGGSAGSAPSTKGGNGSNSSISGSGLTTITSTGGGGGATFGSVPLATGANGGSGGGGTRQGGDSPGGSGNTPSTSPSQGNNGGSGKEAGPNYGSGGGGGAGAVGGNGDNINGGNGGNGTASSITGSSVTRAGGGGGAVTAPAGQVGTGGSGGGGNATTSSPGASGTANTGGGGGGFEGGTGGAGGKGVVILSVPTASYSSTTTGSPTVTTSGANTIMVFNGSGSYTA